MSAIRVQATDEFVKFARPAASQCGSDKMLLLSYNYVQTRSSKEFRWVLNVVNRADFHGVDTTTVAGLEILYQPEMAERLNNSTVDFRNGRITVTRR
jgi:hypothetical protein